MSKSTRDGILIHKDLPCSNCGRLWGKHTAKEFETCTNILAPPVDKCLVDEGDDEACILCPLANTDKCPHRDES